MKTSDKEALDVCAHFISSGDLEGLRGFLKGSKLNLNKRLGDFKLTLLHLAAASNRLHIATWLIENGAKVSRREKYSQKTPLHLAAYFGHLEMMDLLIHHVVDELSYSVLDPHPNEHPDEIFRKDVLYCSPVHYAVMGGHLEAVKFLIKKGEELNFYSSVGTALDIAIRKGFFEMVDFVSTNIGSQCLEKKGGFGPFSVHLSMVSGQKTITKMLLNKFPQFPSESLKEDWEREAFSYAFFSIIENRKELLRLIYEDGEIPSLIQGADEYLKRERELRIYPANSILKALHAAIEEKDFEKVGEIVEKEGWEILSKKTKKLLLRTKRVDYLCMSAIDVAARLYCFPFFDWLVQKGVFLLPFQSSIFERWCLIDIHPRAGDFFQRIQDLLDRESSEEAI